MYLIRFTRKIEYLCDEILNGFLIAPHKVKFQSTNMHVLNRLLHFYRNFDSPNTVIQEIKEMKQANASISDFESKIESDPRKKAELQYILNAGATFNIWMKCFTELRDNQKINPIHTEKYGNFGISLSDNWAKSNSITPVIYHDQNDNVSTILGTFISLSRSLFTGNIDIEEYVLDLVALLQQRDDYNEYEWRYVAGHPLRKPSSNRLIFEISDINEIFVPSLEYRNKLIEFFKINFDTEKLPQVSLTQNVVLSENELKEINRIKRR